jgi:hypothetical protein
MTRSGNTMAEYLGMRWTEQHLVFDVVASVEEMDRIEEETRELTAV